MKVKKASNPINNTYDLFEKGNISSNQVLNSFINNHIQTGPFVQEPLEELLNELHELIGLDNVKKLINEIIAYVEVQKKRKHYGLNANPVVLHMIFKGNPGTGKTTVARLLGRIFKVMGILEKGHLIEVERADLVGEYIGHTAIKVREQIKLGLGGIFFIDEAYSLARGGEKDFGKEAIDAIVKSMEDHKDHLILILAGYQDEMNHFLQMNPGLQSRFPIYLDFQDYNLEELVEIAELMVKEREYVLLKSAKAKLFNLLSLKIHKDRVPSGNARLVRNMVERAIRKQAVRLQSKSAFTREDLITLQREDFVDGDD